MLKTVCFDPSSFCQNKISSIWGLFLMADALRQLTKILQLCDLADRQDVLPKTTMWLTWCPRGPKGSIFSLKGKSLPSPEPCTCCTFLTLMHFFIDCGRRYISLDHFCRFTEELRLYVSASGLAVSARSAICVGPSDGNLTTSPSRLRTQMGSVRFL